VTPRELAESFYGGCVAAGDGSPWCNIHEDYWPLLVYPQCPVMTGYIDLVEQARADLRTQVEALTTVRIDGSTVVWLDRDAVLALMDSRDLAPQVEPAEPGRP